MIHMTNIQNLIKKYYKPIGKDMTGTNKKNPGERYNNTYAKYEKMNANLKYRHSILSDLLCEIPFKLTHYQIQQIKLWIDTFNEDFKAFHRQASNETIILAFIMIQQKNANPKTQLENYSICQKYNLNDNTFNLIQNRLIFQLMRTTPLTYALSKYLDHEILMKGEQR